MDTGEVETVAQGRIWTGKQARERGLVDSLGGLQTAIEKASEILETDKEIRLVEFTGEEGLFHPTGLSDLVSAKVREQLHPEMKKLLEVSETLKRFEDEWILLIMPYTF